VAYGTSNFQWLVLGSYNWSVLSWLLLLEVATESAAIAGVCRTPMVMRAGSILLLNSLNLGYIVPRTAKLSHFSLFAGEKRCTDFPRILH